MHFVTQFLTQGLSIGYLHTGQFAVRKWHPNLKTDTSRY